MEGIFAPSSPVHHWQESSKERHDPDPPYGQEPPLGADPRPQDHDPRVGSPGCLHRPPPFCHPYFPEPGEVPPPDALARCDDCPVAAECLASALAHEAVDGDRHGWWGGLGPADRNRLWASLAPTADDLPILAMRDLVAIAIRLRSQRRSVKAIAAEIGCTERTVYRYLATQPA